MNVEQGNHKVPSNAPKNEPVLFYIFVAVAEILLIGTVF